ncbi:Hpt domain-containing protein [Lutibacter citreus]|uniref:Hpt domain-containing protein n=1 Tax=Lutibacter citreus TaxID=2138210 RepID=UPI000DBE9AA0|nr:Hpt domain-containing protein [Lutibacter citreus]
MTEKPNLEYLKELSGGDIEFEQKMLEVVKKELPVEIENYKKHLVNKQFNEAAELVHKIKHKISVLGLEESYQVAIDYEEELKKGQIKQQKSFEDILDSMTIFVENV